MSAIILRPLINEKSMALTKLGFYTFEVSKNATKAMIEKIVKSKFKVDILSVKTINISGKRKMQRAKRAYFFESSAKKAIVKLKKGQKIPLFEVAEEEKEVEVRTAEGEVIAKTKEKKSLLGRTKVKIEETKVESAEKPERSRHLAGKAKGGGK